MTGKHLTGATSPDRAPLSGRNSTKPPATVTVAEVKPVTVTKAKAWRLILGRAVVDFLETFAALIVGVGLFMPSNADDVQKLGILLATPAIAALVSAGRRSWPAIRAWLLGEEAK